MHDEIWAENGVAYRKNDFQSSRKTLVFIHGLGNSCSVWQPIETMLENDFNILTYDLRGHGRSQKYRSLSEYHLELFTDDLQLLLAHLKIVSCTLISSSMGTLLALSYLRREPSTVQANLLIAPVYKQNSRANAIARTASGRIAKLLGFLPFYPRPGARVDYSTFSSTKDLDATRIFREIKCLSLRIYLFCLAHVYSFADDAWWSTIRTPTTILHGTDDTFAPYELAVELSQAMPRARLVTLKGANHILVINNIPDIIELIRQTAEERSTPA